MAVRSVVLTRPFAACVFAIAMSVASVGSALGADAATPAPPRERFSWQFRIEVGVDGVPAIVEAPAFRSSALSERVAAMIRTWRFEPATINGKPVVSRTGLHLELVGETRADGTLALFVDHAVAAPSIVYETTPEYPEVDFRGRVGGTVMLQGTVKSSGRIGDARVVESNAPNAFVRSAMRAFRGSRYVADEIDGKRREMALLKPYVFLANDREAASATAGVATVASSDGPRLVSVVAGAPL